MSSDKKPFFSVVIPTYNRARLLERAISSVSSQTCQDFEVIVVDNSSADNTRQFLDAINDMRLHIVEVENQGVIAYSRNAGIRKAKGEWIAFLDDDDVWLPEKLAWVYEAIVENPGVILLCHHVLRVVNGVRRGVFNCTPSVSSVYESLLFHRNCIVTSAVTLRKDIAEKNGGFSERRDFVSVEDIDFWIRLSQIGGFHFIDKPLGELHIHAGSGRNNAELHADASICMGEYHLAIWKKDNPGSEAKFKKARGRRWAGAAHTLLKGARFSKARGYALKAISIHPFQWKAWAVLVLSIVRIPI